MPEALRVSMGRIVVSMSEEPEPFETPAEEPRAPMNEPAGEAVEPAGEAVEPAGGAVEPAESAGRPEAFETQAEETPEPVAEEPPELFAEEPPVALAELVLSEVRPSVTVRPGQEAGLVVLAEMDEPFRSLHMYVGQSEAKAIDAGWRGGRPARPGTWDLLLEAIERLGGRLDRVVIDRVEEARHFYATLEIESSGTTLSLGCRPSDAIALAVRVPDCGLYTTEQVLSSAGRYP